MNKTKIKFIGRRIYRITKMLLFVSVIYLSYLISDKTIDYLMSVDTEILKRSLNIILAIIIAIFYLKGDK